MKRKAASGIILQLIFISTLMLAFNIQQLQPVFEGKAELTPPVFVTQNKLIYESGASYQWLDPHVSYYQFDYWTLWHSVETLFWYEKDNATKIIPWLVESCTVTSDNKHYNLTLRQGITFQDGTPFNATAVWFSLNRLLMIDGTSGDGLNHGSQAAWIVQQMLNETLSYYWSGRQSLNYKCNWNATFVRAVLDQNFVEILDNYRVRLNLLTPSTQFLPIMAGLWAGIISPTSTIKMDYQHGGWGTWDGNYTKYWLHMAGVGETGLVLPQNGWKVGTGPYYIESVQPTAPYLTVLKKFDNYWGGPNDMNLPPAGKTRIATLEFKYIPSFTTRLLDLKAGIATGIPVPTANIFQVVDREKWFDQGILESIIPGVTMYGPFSQFTTWWLCLNTNVTKPGSGLREWQPFADYRIRMAVASSVNITDMNKNVNSKLGVVANSVVPPNTFPPGSYNPNTKVTFSFNLTKAEVMLKAARDNPLTSFTFYNGTAIPWGIVNNSFGPDFAHAKPIEFYVQADATEFQGVLVTMADNLNSIAEEHDLGIRFNVVIVPSGQQYTLASQHLIDSYMGGWIADYNHVLNWLGPMYQSTGTYFSWNLWNLTRLDDLYDQAVAADQAGNVADLLAANDAMNTLANDVLTYMVWWYPTLQFARSTWLKGWYVNTVHGVDLWSTMYYEAPSDVTPPVTTISLEGTLIENDWFTSDVTVTLLATDDYQVEKTEYSFDNATWIPYATPFDVSEEGHLTIYYKSTDKTGNEEITKTKTLKIDKTAPTGDIVINNDDVYTTSTSVTLALTSTDTTSDVYQLRLSNDGVWDTEQWEIPSTAKAWTLTSGDGQKTVNYQVKDNAGLISTTLSDTITLDTKPPSGSVTMAGDSAYTNTTSLTLTLLAGDATSGVARMRFSHDNSVWTPWEAYSASKTWTLTTGDGQKTVYVQYIDAAGLTSGSYSDTIVLDTTVPTITITSPGLGYEIKSSMVRVTWTCSDEGSGPSHCEIKIDDDSWINVGTDTVHTFTGVNDGTHTVNAKVYDKAGWSGMDSVEFTVNTSPQFGLGYFEIAAIGAMIIIAVVAVAVYLLKFRK